MNWRRGFIRLWLLLSVIWIGAAAVLFSLPHSLTVALMRREPTMAERFGSLNDIPAPPPVVGGYGRDPTEPPKPRDRAAELGLKPPAPSREELLQRIDRGLAIDRLWGFAALGIGVPAAAFVLGMGGWWVARGFKYK